MASLMDSCHICGQPVAIHGRATVRAKYEAVFVRCRSCGFISVQNPFWLPEAYAEPINASDTGYLSRNLWCQDRVKMVVELHLDPAGQFLDYAAGYGVFVRLMRDLGYDFRWTDGYCQNLFARHFEATLSPASRFDAITAFEVFEHLVEPMTVLHELAQWSPCLILSTDLVPEIPPAPGQWWYYGLEHGQHVSFYSRATLEYIAEKLGLFMTTDGLNFHLLTKERLPQDMFQKIDSRWRRAWIRRTRRRQSLRESDHEMVVRLHRVSPSSATEAADTQ